MWIDAHCHLSDARVFGRSEELLRECERSGLTRFLLGGVDPEEWERQRQLARRHPGRFHLVFGLHPWWVDQATSEQVELGLRRLREEASGVCAIGEAGLDGARGRLKRSRDLQIRAFRAQLEIAREAGKPLVLHIVRAHPLALEILEETANQGLTGLVHSFSGTLQDAHRYLKSGWLLSFSARITHPEAAALAQVLRACPADRLVFETDAPDQAPYGHPDSLHSPVSLFKVVQKASDIRNETPETLLARSRENLVRVFALKA